MGHGTENQPNEEKKIASGFFFEANKKLCFLGWSFLHQQLPNTMFYWTLAPGGLRKKFWSRKSSLKNKKLN